MAAALKIADFNLLDDAQCDARIEAAKNILGRKLVILGHHYQRTEVYKHATLDPDGNGNADTNDAACSTDPLCSQIDLVIAPMSPLPEGKVCP